MKLSLDIVKSLHKVEENTHKKAQGTLEFTLTQTNINFDSCLIIPEKSLMGVANLQVYNTVYNITWKKNEIAQNIPGLYEREPVYFENVKEQSAQKTVEYTLQSEIDSANKYEKELKIKGEHGLEKYTYNLSDLNYDLPRKNNIEGLKAMNYGGHYNDEDHDMY